MSRTFTTEFTCDYCGHSEEYPVQFGHPFEWGWVQLKDKDNDLDICPYCAEKYFFDRIDRMEKDQDNQEAEK